MQPFSKYRKPLNKKSALPTLVFLLWAILFSPSCALILKKIHPNQGNGQTNKSISKKNHGNKKIKSSDIMEFQAVKKAEKEVVSELLRKKEITQLKKILKTTKILSLKERIKMILGRHFLKTLSYKQALFYYSRVKEDPWRKQSLLQEASIYYKMNQPEKVFHLIEFLLDEEELSPELSIKANQLKLTLLLRDESRNQKEILKAYCHILNYKDNSSENTKTSLYEKKARQLIYSMTEKDLLDIVDEDFIDPVKDQVFFRAGKILFYRENFKQAYSVFKRFLRFSTEIALEENTLKYIQAIESRKMVNQKRIGAVLPLSGPSAKIGQRSLKGLQLGLGFYKNKDNPFELVILDSHGQQDKARKAVQTLVIKHHVIAIVGGILSRTAGVLAEEAQNFGVPALLLTQKSKITQTGHYIFQNSLTSSLIADQLTDFLTTQLKARRFAILYPNDPYGVDYANAFWSAVEKKGGTITGAQFYKPGETDFNGPIRRLTGTYYLKDRIEEYKDTLKTWYIKKSYLSTRRTPPPKNILPPIVDFDILFIPDSLKTLNLIAPHIVYNDIKDIKLAGPNLWNQKKLLIKNSKYVKNIIFADPGLTSTDFKKTDFYKHFHRIFNHKPGLFELQAYESSLAIRQIIASGADTRSKLREQLAGLQQFYGPMGKIIISDDREFLRSLHIFKMEEGILSPLNPVSPEENKTRVSYKPLKP